jgi:hypothetical protein
MSDGDDIAERVARAYYAAECEFGIIHKPAR